MPRNRSNMQAVLFLTALAEAEGHARMVKGDHPDIPIYDLEGNVQSSRTVVFQKGRTSPVPRNTVLYPNDLWTNMNPSLESTGLGGPGFQPDDNFWPKGCDQCETSDIQTTKRAALDCTYFVPHAHLGYLDRIMTRVEAPHAPLCTHPPPLDDYADQKILAVNGKPVNSAAEVQAELNAISGDGTAVTLTVRAKTPYEQCNLREKTGTGACTPGFVQCREGEIFTGPQQGEKTVCAGPLDRRLPYKEIMLKQPPSATFKEGHNIVVGHALHSNHGGVYGYGLSCRRTGNGKDHAGESYAEGDFFPLKFVEAHGRQSFTSNDRHWRWFEQGINCAMEPARGTTELECNNSHMSLPTDDNPQGCICETPNGEKCNTGLANSDCQGLPDPETPQNNVADCWCNAVIYDEITIELPNDVVDGDNCVLLYRWDAYLSDNCFVQCVDVDIDLDASKASSRRSPPGKQYDLSCEPIPASMPDRVVPTGGYGQNPAPVPAYQCDGNTGPGSGPEPPSAPSPQSRCGNSPTDAANSCYGECTGHNSGCVNGMTCHPNLVACGNPQNPSDNSGVPLATCHPGHSAWRPEM